REPLHGGHDRHARALEGGEEVGERPDEFAQRSRVLAGGGEELQVRPRAEMVPGRADEHDPGGPREVAKRRLEFAYRRQVDGVAGLGPIERDDTNATVRLHLEPLPLPVTVAHRHASVRVIRAVWSMD